jgi:alkanesulfonate monooxygenase SsuD/methylene tetrahydromethanopterin reductase-like flavin-dependent oxidoreductase (luciferase family)
MKYWISLVTTMEVDQYVEIARFAEQVGFEGITVADHLVIPTVVETPYPYTPDGAMWWPMETPWPDPWVALATMGAATSRIKLGSNIYIAALRDPFTAARAIGTAAVLSGDRIVCGVAAGWLPEEYALLGIDFGTRGKRLDEMIEVWRKLWTGDEVEHHGAIFDFEHALMLPAPGRARPLCAVRRETTAGWACRCSTSSYWLPPRRSKPCARSSARPGSPSTSCCVRWSR